MSQNPQKEHKYIPNGSRRWLGPQGKSVYHEEPEDRDQPLRNQPCIQPIPRDYGYQSHGYYNRRSQLFEETEIANSMVTIDLRNFKWYN